MQTSTNPNSNPIPAQADPLNPLLLRKITKKSSSNSSRAKKKWPNRTSCVSAGRTGGVYAIFAFNCSWLANGEKRGSKKEKKYVENLIANGHQISHHQSMLHGVVVHRIVQIFILEYIFIDISSTTLSAFGLTFSWSPIWFSFLFDRIDALVTKLIRAFILCAKAHWRTSIGLGSDGGQGLLSTYKLQAYGIWRMYNKLF